MGEYRRNSADLNAILKHAEINPKSLTKISQVSLKSDLITAKIKF
jgi:hypothetical protein